MRRWYLCHAEGDCAMVLDQFPHPIIEVENTIKRDDASLNRFL